MVLLELFRETFPEVHIETLYADREFIGNEWLAYLRQAGISYCIRCKENAQIAGKGGTRRALKSHFRALKTGEGKRLGPVMMYGQQHYPEATRLSDGQLLVVCSDKEGKGQKHTVSVGRPVQSLFRAGLDRLVSVLSREMRLLEILGGEVMDLLVVKEDVG